MLLPCLVFFFLSLCYVETKKKRGKVAGQQIKGTWWSPVADPCWLRSDHVISTMEWPSQEHFWLEQGKCDYTMGTVRSCIWARVPRCVLHRLVFFITCRFRFWASLINNSPLSHRVIPTQLWDSLPTSSLPTSERGSLELNNNLPVIKWIQYMAVLNIIFFSRFV